MDYVFFIHKLDKVGLLICIYNYSKLLRLICPLYDLLGIAGFFYLRLRRVLRFVVVPFAFTTRPPLANR